MKNNSFSFSGRGLLQTLRNARFDDDFGQSETFGRRVFPPLRQV